MNAIRWIFFDIGSTLVDEEEAYNHRIRDMIQGTSVTFEQFLDKRIQFAKEGYNGDQKAIEYFGLNKTPWHSEEEVPFDDCEEILRALCDRGYQLGIIANQKPGAKDRLDAWGLGRYFSVIASSAELGVSKPDNEIFRQRKYAANRNGNPYPHPKYVFTTGTGKLVQDSGRKINQNKGSNGRYDFFQRDGR